MSISGWDVREGNAQVGPGGLGTALDSRDTHGVDSILLGQLVVVCVRERDQVVVLSAHGEQGLAEKRKVK